MTQLPVSSRSSQAAVETALITALFFLVAGSPPPDVNEAHYLAKAKHYWNPEWCAGDFFLESADAHLVFYWSFGWLTLYFPLPMVAWFGRFLTWGLLAWSWQRLSRAVLRRPGYAVLSAALFAVFMRWGHMAGEWVVGGVEAKGFAYVLLFLALEQLVRGRWRTSLLVMGASAAFHVLVGGWAIVALAWTWLWCRQNRPSFKQMLLPVAGAFLLSLPGLLPALHLTRSVDPHVLEEANRIYVFERLSHHLVFHEMRHDFILRHAVLMVCFLCVWRKTETDTVTPAFAGPLPRFILGSILIAVLGVLVDQSLLYLRPLAATLLRYYWFRMSDVMTPLGVAFGVLVWQRQLAAGESKWGPGLLIGLSLVAAADVAAVLWQRGTDPRPGAAIQAFPGDQVSPAERLRRLQEWKAVCEWVDRNTPRDAIFLTPRHQQTFKWDANRAEVVSGKDVPQDAVGIVRWRRRMNDVFPWAVRYADLSAHGEPRLRELAKKYHFQYLILDRQVSAGTLPFHRVYPSELDPPTRFEVYEVR